MFGKRLRLARKRAGLSMAALAEQLNPRVTPQAISKYEAGKMLPSSPVLVALGKTLDVSLDFLMSAPDMEIDGLEFRKRSRTSVRDRARAEAALIDNLQRYLAIEGILDIPVAIDWAERHRCDSIVNEAQIDDQADALRKEWHLGTGPIPSLCALLEDKGLKVIEDDLPESVNGLACRVLRGGEPVADAVVISAQINIERKRFTLAHEVAHRIIPATGNSAMKLERAMNRFAGAFLVPRQRLLADMGAGRQIVTPYEIIRLKHIYGVSAASMLVRLGQVGILRPGTVQRAFSTFARRWRRIEPDPIRPNHGFAAFEKPRRFKLLVARALAEQLISPVRAASLLKESLEVVERRLSDPTLQ